MPGRKTSDETATVSLTGAKVVIAPRAGETLRLAAGEMARYLYLLTGKPSEVVRELPSSGPVVALGRRVAKELGVSVGPNDLGEEGYVLRAAKLGHLRAAIVAGATSAGTLYGVYGLLEELGMGFHAGGDTFPDLPASATVPLTLDKLERPAFSARGNMLHYNFLCGCTDWGLADYKFYFDQLARMRANTLLMHWYDGEPGAAYEVAGEYLAGGRTPNSLTKPWGAVKALRTSEFSFGTGRFFDEEIYTGPPGDDFPDLLTEIKRTEAMFAEATRYAKVRGVRVAAGFEAPPGHTDPTCAETLERFRTRLRRFIERNPDIACFALWQHESGGCTGSAPPPAGSEAARLMEQRRALFAHLGNEWRIWEAVRFGLFAQVAAELLAKEAPRLGMVVVGWGGERWMRFADLCLGYDKLLPPHVVFTCHGNIDASMGPQVSAPWGELPPGRERWAMPWVEGDIDECWVRQPNVESLGKLAPDALAKGCQGLLTLQWRTRDVEEETGYAARFAWDTALTPRRFYRDLAARAFGPDQEARMGGVIERLQKLGARWSGVRGTAECSQMRWTGWEPHFPFELDGAAAAWLASPAEEASRVLAEVPAEGGGPGEGAFHLREESDEAHATDESRLGVGEMADVAGRLRALSGEQDEKRLRSALTEIREQVFALRHRLVTEGMTGSGYRAVDGFLFPIHHLVRNAGAKRHFAALRRIRRELEKLRGDYVKAGRVARLERLDHLASTIDFVLHFDTVAMLLADGERIEQAIAQAHAAREAGNEAEAARIASDAYAELLDAGMRDALLAFARKLTTRCDWGVLTTLNVKPMPKYWEAVRRLSDLMPVAPPREATARGLKDEVWVSWTPSAKAEGYNVHRRKGRGEWRKLNKAPLNAAHPMFIDRPKPGRYEYAVAAIRGDFEGPLSHRAEAVCGPCEAGPRLAACKPHSHAPAGHELPVRVVAVGDRDVASVTLAFRNEPAGKWQRTPMRRRFRDSWMGAVPAEAVRAGTLEFYVEAVDVDGGRSLWPESAGAGLPWSLTVT